MSTALTHTNLMPSAALRGAPQAAVNSLLAG